MFSNKHSLASSCKDANLNKPSFLLSHGFSCSVSLSVIHPLASAQTSRYQRSRSTGASFVLLVSHQHHSSSGRYGYFWYHPKASMVMRLEFQKVLKLKKKNKNQTSKQKTQKLKGKFSPYSDPCNETKMFSYGSKALCFIKCRLLTSHR